MRRIREQDWNVTEGCKSRHSDLTSSEYQTPTVDFAAMQVHYLPMRIAPFCLVLIVTTVSLGQSTEPAAPTTRVYKPAVLPGNGLAQHPFLLTGEWDFRKPMQTIFVVRDGKVAWSYAIPIKDHGTLQELGDATMLSNGNIVFCRKVGASEITPDKKIIWNYDAPAGTEIHSVQPLGLDHVLMTIQGNPARALTINTVTGVTEKEIQLPVDHPDKPHMQFRRVRLTDAGTYLTGHVDSGEVVEYDAQGKEIWSVKAFQPWSVVRLKNGNTLIGCSTHGVIEVNPQGQTVWDFTQKDCPDIKLFIIQEVSRLANGNTVMCNWCANGVKNPKDWPGTVQVLEVTPDKKVVWALSSWTDPDLGTASSIQLLDEPGIPEKNQLQR